MEGEADARASQPVEMLDQDGIGQIGVRLAEFEDQVRGEIVILAPEVGEIADEVAVGEAPARDVAEEADAVRLDARLPDQLATAEQTHVVDSGQIGRASCRERGCKYV